jgi:predicted dehydrogenase
VIAGPRGSVTLGAVPAALPVVLVGLGRMGRFHLAALGDVDEVDVVALAEPDPAARQVAADLCPHATAYATVAEALAHPGLEGCIVASPTPSHHAVVDAALRAGLHVLCEKPLALDDAEARSLGDLASRVDRVLQVGFWRRFAPPWRAARDCVVAGAIGTPLYVRLAQWDADPPPASFCDPAVSGGLAIDCGVHEFDLAEWLTGRQVVRVSAWSLPLVDQQLAAVGDVDNLVAVLELDGGGVATVDLTRNARYGDDARTELLGSDGAVLIDTLPVGRARIGTAAGMVDLAGSATDDVMRAGVAEQARAFAAAARGTATDTPGAAASIRATAIGRAVIEAAATGERVAIGAGVGALTLGGRS